MVFTPMLLSGGVITESFSARGDDQYKKVECSLAVTVPLQGWKLQFCIGSSIISPCTALSLCKELHDLAPLKSICMALLVYLQFSLQVLISWHCYRQFLIWGKSVPFQKDWDVLS